MATRHRYTVFTTMDVDGDYGGPYPAPYRVLAESAHEAVKKVEARTAPLEKECPAVYCTIAGVVRGWQCVEEEW